MLGRAALIGCVLSACNVVYGLEPTKAVEEELDTDDDGVFDIVDNCDDIVNAFQEDLDDDGVGDVCDECPAGSNHNDDGDTLLDGCDNCPQLANDDQANDDGDDLGDACDPSDAFVHTRVRFDGFELLAVDWIPGAVEWEIFDDSVRPISTPNPTDPGLWNRRLDAQGEGWIIDTTFEPPPPGTQAGLETRQKIGGTEYVCFVKNVGGTYSLETNTSSAPVAPPTGRVRLRLRADGATNVRCELVGGADLSVGPVLGIQTNPGLRTTALTRFYYIDIVRTP
jgi:hypothetical protein